MRLTIRNSDGTVSQPMNLDWSAALEKLAAYEDSELTPEEFKESVDFVLELNKKLKPYMDAEGQGLLVRLPCKVGDTVWFYLYENRGGIRKGIYQGIITELKAVQRLNRDAPLFLAFVRFEYPDPWYSYKQMSTSEMHCSFGDYGSWVQFYLTRAEAEAALKGEREDV